MKKSRFSEEQIIGILKQHEAGVKTSDLCREHGISAATFYAWKSKYGGMDVAEADSSLGSGRVTRVLERLIAEHGRPEAVRSDNGPEFTSRRMLAWAEDHRVSLVHIQPGRPMQNGHVESFHGRLRDQCLNTSWFRTLNDVREKMADWQHEYNCERPHSSLDYRTPQEFRQTLEGRGAMAPFPSKTTTTINQEKLQL